MPSEKANNFGLGSGSGCAIAIIAAARGGRGPPECYHRWVTEQAKSGKRVVVVLLVAALGVSLVAWLAASKLERGTKAREAAAGELRPSSVVSDGVLFEARVGDPGFIIARDVGSGKELWRAELGAVTTKPGVTVVGERVEVEIAGTPWMILDRTSGEAVE